MNTQPDVGRTEIAEQQSRSEHDAALWWRFYYEDERPNFIPPPVKPLRAQTEKHWVAQMWLGQTAFEQGLFSEAEQHFREALLEVQKLGNDTELATTLRSLGRSLCAQDKHDESEPLYKRAIELHEQGASSLELEEDFDAFVLHYRMQRKYREAEALIRSVLEKFEKSGKSAPVFARYLNNLAVMLCEEGRCKEAEEAYHRVLDVTKTFTGKQVSCYALALLNLAVLCLKNNRMSEAKEHYDHAVNILRLLPDEGWYLRLLEDYQQVFRGLPSKSQAQQPLSAYLHASIPPKDKC
jgi:tetratricopeptide (TPR) repeat protein